MSNETALQPHGNGTGPVPRGNESRRPSPPGTPDALSEDPSGGPSTGPSDVSSGPAPRPPRPDREHRYDVDLARLVCSVAVMLGHIGGVFLTAVEREEANGPAVYWTGHLIEAVNPFAVPVFFAIAGWAVLVGAPPADDRRMWRRITRNVLPMFVWTALYLLWGRLWGTNDGPVTRLALDAVFGSVRPAYHLWFMYAYIPLIIALAFAVLLRAGKRPWGLGAVLLVCAAAPSLLADLERWTGWDLPHFGWGFGVYQLMYALGGALLFALPAHAVAGRRLLWTVPLLLTAAGVLWYHTQVHYVIPNAHPLVAVMTGALLMTLVRVRVPERWRPLLGRLSGAALGAYLVHVMVISAIVEPLVAPELSGAVTGPLSVLLLAATVAVSFGASLLWGRLGLRRYLG
ncbi:acyltransferase [Streptomyces carminius]|uniref:acyltransferase n=1 Tax=Streptomyces carminius TaxID=2665496 RepID=UPI002FCE1195